MDKKLKNRKSDNPVVIVVSRSEDEILDSIKKEIHRLGLEDNLSRTEYAKLYDKNNSLSPTGAMAALNMTWKEIMEELGFEYDEIKRKQEKMRVHNTGKKYAQTWSGMTYQEVLDVIVEEMRSKDIWTSTQYKELRDRKNTPSMPMVVKLIGGWGIAKSEYERKYGKV